MTDIRSALSRPVPAAYAPLITQMRFYIEPEISCSRFFGEACFADPHADFLDLSELGAFIAERLRGGLFIDIPCGLASVRDPERDFALPPLVSALGAHEMWEVDATAEVIADRVPRIGGIGTRDEDGLTITTMQDDLLGFVAQLPGGAPSPKAIYLSGLQPHADICTDPIAYADTVLPYLASLYDELSRVSAPGDLVILNSSAMLVTGLADDDAARLHPALALPPRGLSLMRRCAYDKVHVFAKE
jgi:hypothetical protein